MGCFQPAVVDVLDRYQPFWVITNHFEQSGPFQIVSNCFGLFQTISRPYQDVTGCYGQFQANSNDFRLADKIRKLILVYGKKHPKSCVSAQQPGLGGRHTGLFWHHSRQY
jgi:hypothetical protein